MKYGLRADPACAVRFPVARWRMAPCAHTSSDNPETVLAPPAVWITLLLWLLLAVPLFVCMPLNSDTALYDIQARRVMSGGVAYRDIIEPNLPGAMWIHMATRSVVGWTSEAIRIVDLLVVVTALVVWGRLARISRRHFPMLLLAGLFLYCTRNEWCHAQRDTWMLLPVGVALLIRCRVAPTGHRWSLAEGLCWGIAFWIKPHVLVPALFVMAVDFLAFRRNTPGTDAPRNSDSLFPILSFLLSPTVRELAVIITGGLLAAVPGVVWLWHSGAWDHFLSMMLEWNPEYVAAGRARMSWLKWQLLLQRFAPWPVLHLVGLPLAMSTIVGALRDGRSVDRPRILLSACYLGWLAQSVLLQHALDYIHVPALILALLVLLRQPWALPVIIRRTVVAGFFVLSVFGTPFLLPSHLAQWSTAVCCGSTPAVRTSLAHGNLPQWDHLFRVIRELKRRNVTDGDVTCLNVHSVHVYNELQIAPSTRYWSVSILQDLFPERAGQISREVHSSGHRYVVIESAETRMLESAAAQSWLLNCETVFESGTYRILKTDQHAPSIAQRYALYPTRSSSTSPVD